jgi:hypothetical protein
MLEVFYRPNYCKDLANEPTGLSISIFSLKNTLKLVLISKKSLNAFSIKMRPRPLQYFLLGKNKYPRIMSQSIKGGISFGTKSIASDNFPSPSSIKIYQINKIRNKKENKAALRRIYNN